MSVQLRVFLLERDLHMPCMYESWWQCAAHKYSVVYAMNMYISLKHGLKIDKTLHNFNDPCDCLSMHAHILQSAVIVPPDLPLGALRLPIFNSPMEMHTVINAPLLMAYHVNTFLCTCCKNTGNFK